MYRGIIKGLHLPKHRQVFGYWCKVQDKHYIILDDAEIHPLDPDMGGGFADGIKGFVEVLPSSLAMSTGIDDKNGLPIYGSFEVDGVMSKGGSGVEQLYNPAIGLYRTGVVEYCKDLAAFSLMTTEGHCYELTIMVGGRCGERLEVIPKEKRNG